MGLQIVTPPAIEPLTLDDAKLHMRVDSTDDDTLISALITAARNKIEGYTQRTLITQTWEYVLDMPNNKQRIPQPPLQRINNITLIDTDGSKSIIDPTTYIVDTSGTYGRITPTKASRLAFVDPDLWRGIWPWHRGFASFIINFDCGYGDTSDKVPAALVEAIRLYVDLLYDNREGQPTNMSSGAARASIALATIGSTIPESVRALCSPYMARVL